MSWLAILSIILLGVVLTAVVVLLIENHSRLAPLLARWEWVAWLLLACPTGFTAWEQWMEGRSRAAMVSLVAATAWGTIALVTLRRRLAG